MKHQTNDFHHSVCPHDCPSSCALEVERIDENTIGRVRGAKHNSYTAGVICSKVARYAERIHHPNRLTQPLRRVGAKGGTDFRPVAWDNALDEVAERFLLAEQRLGSETVWPYFYAGTMGLVMRDGINRLRHAKKYSGQHSTICVMSAWNGYLAGTGKLLGADPREMAKADAVVIWGTNAASTQVNVMTHALRARRDRQAKIIVIDVYENATSKQADLFLCVKPGTDGALACAVMHILFRDDHANWEYLNQYTDCPRDLKDHLETRDPEWAAQITGLSVAEIENFAAIVGERPRSYFRLGYGFSRQRNGVINMHAASCIPAVTGAWLHEGGGAFHNNGAIYHWDRTLIDGLDVLDPSIRLLDQSRIGAVLTGDAGALHGGPPVSAMLIQNTNPVSVAPDQNVVKRGFARDDLFVCVHEQFMTETAAYADIVLPATMFMEHDDVYQGGGHQHIMLGPQIVQAPGECRSNHEVISALAKRLGAKHKGFEMQPYEIIDWTLRHSGWGSLDDLRASHWIDCQPDFNEAHFIDGFAHGDKKFHFSPDWSRVALQEHGPSELDESLPRLPDHWHSIEAATDDCPYRLVTAPARHFLNSSFNETPTSVRREQRPTVLIHPQDALVLDIVDGASVILGNARGEVELRAKLHAGQQPGVVISESIWPNSAFNDGSGINALTGADPVAPSGGAAFHDNRIWIRRTDN
ncbi:MAG: molybdopterin oxidoreductase family protein [Gammaproteobacteria bacterium]